MHSALRSSRAVLRRLALGTLVAGAVAATAVGVAAGNDARSAIPAVAFERYQLDNGLEVILHRDNAVPLVAVDVWYHVGSGREVPGRSGFAHLFEHMLFQGSKHVGEDKHFSTLQNVGSTAVNGTTNTDRTNYFEVVPSHQLETALWLESDRMGYLLPMLTQKSLANQIEVVRNERRQSYDNRPYGGTWLALYKALYPEGHPYRYSTIGRHEDLAAATLRDVTDFYKKWYVPANATLVLAGDFDTAQAKALIQKWFGSFPKSAKPSGKAIEPPPMPVIERSRTRVRDDLAKLRMLTYAWHTPAFFADGDAEFDIVAHALGDRGTGRLYRTLVHQKQLAQQVTVSQSSQQFSSIFRIQVQLKSGADLAEVERIIDAELAAVRSKPITPEEFQRAVTSVETLFIWGLEPLLSRAELLQRYNHYVGEPDYIARDLARYTSTNPEKVRWFAERFLAPERRVELITSAGENGGK